MSKRQVFLAMKLIPLIMTFILMLFNQPASASESYKITGLYVSQYNVSNTPYFCIKISSDRGYTNKACVFKSYGESKILFDELYSLARTIYLNKIQSYIYIKENVWTDGSIISKFTSNELIGLKVVD